ncbi:hypothetical protein ACFCXG_39070, partial [Streptomyces sp. NPDC056295]
MERTRKLAEARLRSSAALKGDRHKSLAKVGGLPSIVAILGCPEERPPFCIRVKMPSKCGKLRSSVASKDDRHVTQNITVNDTCLLRSSAAPKGDRHPAAAEVLGLHSMVAIFGRPKGQPPFDGDAHWYGL